MTADLAPIQQQHCLVMSAAAAVLVVVVDKWWSCTFLDPEDIVTLSDVPMTADLVPIHH